MTDETPHGEHVSDEHLSTLLDDAGDVAAPSALGASAAHLDVCGVCRRRLAELDAARELLRTPVPPVSDAERAAAVARVLRRAGPAPERHARPAPERHARPAPERHARPALERHDRPAPGRHAPPVVRYERSHRRRAAVAAVVVAGLALAAGVSLTLLSSSTSSSISAGPAARARAASTTTAQPVGSPQKAASAAAAPSVSGLGAVSTPAQLRADVDDLLAARTTAGMANAGVTPSYSVTGCAAAGRAAVGTENDPRLEVTATYAGIPAVVYVFGPAVTPAHGPDAPNVAVALAVAGCRLLAKTAL